ncbi:MAG: PAS domain-containing protein, partial [Bacteroidota bacterium]|nr:PAS domain-containing protein [Bacteroidota bacterium]
MKEESTFRQIIILLKAKHNVDFTYYKQTTIRRRILRRKALNKLEHLKDYLSFLLENKEEQEALFKDILIPVTAFFRDPKTFDILSESVFAQLFKDKTDAEPIRIWVTGCSTGEEAYSMAICLYEYFNETIQEKKIQIFATDISEQVIAKARSGIYLKKDMAGISDDRIKKFFTRIDGSYQMNKEVRQMCVFACHNILKDPPFAKMDLISCRNVLIYMEPYLQTKAFNTFHYALNDKGFLLLGKSETPTPASEQFKQFGQGEKLYSRKASGKKYMQVATKGNETVLKQKDDQLKKGDGGKDDFGKAADAALLTKYASVGVIVNEQLEILQFRGRTSAYLEAAPGKASHNILAMAREGLAFELRNALHKAKETFEVVKKENIPVGKEGRKIDVEVIPLQNTIDPYFLVLFKDMEEEENLSIPKKGKKPTKEEGIKKNGDTLRIEQLEKELLQAREDMRGITEEQEAANEELQSANEELLSGSEELQSLNEELETSKEEIQSSNEELTSLNGELIERNEQLIYSRKYAEAIVTTIHEPLVVLTKNFKIKSANKCFYEKFAVTEKQIEGKSFFELSNGLWNVPGLQEVLQRILPDQAFFEKFEVAVTLPSNGPRFLSLKAHQIINGNNSEQLILLAFQDITEQKTFDDALKLQVYNRTQELQEANLHLQQSNENLQQFASIASHDLQEPLRKIKTFAALLNHRFADVTSAGERDLISKINLAAVRMSQLIKEVLEYSKLAHASRNYVPTDLDAVLKNVLSVLDLLVAEKNAVIRYQELLPT